MKIAQYHGENGKRDNVRLIKGMDKSAFDNHWDRIYVTSLFSFEWKKTEETIDFAIKLANGDSSRVFVGGIAASLMTEQFNEIPRWAGVRFIRGLLDKSPLSHSDWTNSLGNCIPQTMIQLPLNF